MTVKSIHKNCIFGAMFRNHRPKINEFSKCGLFWIEGSGRIMPDALKNKKRNMSRCHGTFVYGAVNHHSLRSIKSFLAKAQGGYFLSDEGIGIDAQGVEAALNFWKDRNRGLAHSEHTPKRPKGNLEFERQLHADPTLGEMYQGSITIHEAKVEKFISTRNGERLTNSIGYFGLP